MTEICMRQWSTLEKQALKFILINVLSRPSVVVFFGNLCIPEGIKLNPKKVEALKQMQPPINKQQLSSFLGKVAYFSQFYANYFFLDFRSERFAYNRCIVSVA